MTTTVGRGFLEGTRGKIELNLMEDDDQEEQVLAKLLGEAIKNVFEAYFDLKQLRPVVEWFEAGKTFQTGDRLPSAAYAAIPPLARAVAAFLERPELADIARQAAAALVASIAELILEGLHTLNRLNKTAQGAESVFRR